MAEKVISQTEQVKLKVKDIRNAGKSPISRWGKVDFDANGDAEITVPVSDIVKVNELGWLSEEDAKEFLKLQPVVQTVDAKSVAPIVAENEDLKNRLRIAYEAQNSEREHLLSELKNTEAKHASLVDEHAKLGQDHLDAIKAYDELCAKHAKLESDHADLIKTCDALKAENAKLVEDAAKAKKK